ncbi:GNAT family N-acetyltransferase [Leucobacter chinensis]|uniref:GNAT family N-acetyltransferase n=1 Tax=Leucobacter chinensis TaxID=2851010 RepID=UPI001C216B7B|nr:GNAT family N-acetyltransferase [Leucobacter chinensis]
MSIRPFAPSDASALTTMLHRAYAELGAAGLNFTAVDQDVQTTLRRALGGQTWVYETDATLCAALAISWPAEASLRSISREANVPKRAWLNQLAVDPEHRRKGLARELRDIGFAWCREQGATSLGLDTALPATHLIELYSGWGFETIERVQWPGKTYESVVMTRSLAKR